MSDAAKSGDLPLLGVPMPLPGSMLMLSPRFRAPRIHNHGPGEYCFFCPCQDCCMFFGRGVPNRWVEPLELTPPRYGDMGLVNAMRAAAAKREEDRQNKLRAELEGTTTAEAPKKDNATKDKPKKKKLRQSMKRRRQ